MPRVIFGWVIDGSGRLRLFVERGWAEGIIFIFVDLCAIRWARLLVIYELLRVKGSRLVTSS